MANEEVDVVEQRKKLKQVRGTKKAKFTRCYNLLQKYLSQDAPKDELKEACDSLKEAL